MIHLITKTGGIIRFETMDAAEHCMDQLGGDFRILDHFPTEQEYFSDYRIPVELAAAICSGKL